MAIKQFARIIGVVLILVGIVGLVLGNKLWLGILNIDIVEDIVHLVTGGLLAYVGFGRTDLVTTRNLVLALGVIYLAVGILGFLVPMMFGLIPHGYTVFDDLLHLALGVLSIVIAFTYRRAVRRRPAARIGAPKARERGCPPWEASPPIAAGRACTRPRRSRSSPG